MSQYDFYTPSRQLQALLDAGDLVRATWAVVGVWEQSSGRQPSHIFEQSFKARNPFMGHRIEQEKGDAEPRFLWRVRGGLYIAAPSERGSPVRERAAPLAGRSDEERDVAEVVEFHFFLTKCISTCKADSRKLLYFAAHSRIHPPPIPANANGEISQWSQEEADVADICRLSWQLLEFADNARIPSAAAGYKIATEGPHPRILLDIHCPGPFSVAANGAPAPVQLVAASNTSATTSLNGAEPSTAKRAGEDCGEAEDHE
ncbi:hypothetical protein AURDEDRAFT_121989 [Auricularia subglabra TFB-10046 SS5]|nr:hypothetical protein AURDEDRAFT_121989 [Auricularia subglabra TFB-10046 SS5]